MSWNDAFNDPQQDLFKNIDPMSGVSYSANSNTISINANDPQWTTYNTFSSVNIDTILDERAQKTAIQLGDEELDERMLKRWRIFWDMMENDPRFADIIQDIDTQIAFEKLGEDNDEA